eukprot:4492258-Alexandrium_andersonii.AAC.1
MVPWAPFARAAPYAPPVPEVPAPVPPQVLQHWARLTVQLPGFLSRRHSGAQHVLHSTASASGGGRAAPLRASIPGAGSA